MPTGTYGVHDWGAETAYSPDARGTRLVTKPGVSHQSEWPKVTVLDLHEGAMGQEVAAIGLAAAELDNSVPILHMVVRRLMRQAPRYMAPSVRPFRRNAA